MVFSFTSSKMSQKSSKIGPVGARRLDFWDFGRFWKKANFWWILGSAKMGQKSRKSGKFPRKSRKSGNFRCHEFFGIFGEKFRWRMIAHAVYCVVSCMRSVLRCISSLTFTSANIVYILYYCWNYNRVRIGRNKRIRKYKTIRTKSTNKKYKL